MNNIPELNHLKKDEKIENNHKEMTLNEYQEMLKKRRAKQFEEKKLFNFQPKVLSLKEFNPLDKPEFSLLAMLLSFRTFSVYRRKYFMINNFTLASSTLIINYFCIYYLLVNWHHLLLHIEKENKKKILRKYNFKYYN